MAVEFKFSDILIDNYVYNVKIAFIKNPPRSWEHEYVLNQAQLYSLLRKIELLEEKINKEGY